MEKFYLEKPTMVRKDEALEYIKEHIEYHSEMNGTGSIEKCLEEISYEELKVIPSERGEGILGSTGK